MYDEKIFLSNLVKILNKNGYFSESRVKFDLVRN